MSDEKLILLTNDDGIRSPGLWAAARALEPLGFVVVAAPSEQWSGAGRSMPGSSSGRIHTETVQVNGEAWMVHAVEGTPAQVIQHAMIQLVPRLPDLVVSGINYGENVGSGVTISGTVGAALEGASFGVPGLAVSLETDSVHHYASEHSTEVDFSAAAYFTRYFAERMLRLKHPPDVDVLKVEVPADATPATPWKITRLSRQRYYSPLKPARERLSDPGKIAYQRDIKTGELEPDSDVHALVVARVVSVTPLSLDLTARVDFREMQRLLENGNSRR